MDKGKLTDITEDTMENTIENTTENINDPEASALFKELFLEDGKALEEEALAHPFTVDEERKEALRRRILAAAEEENLITEASENDSIIDSNSKKKKHRFSPLVRWAAVLALVCAGVFGVSMTSQAKDSGLWSSIQRLIGGETRWEQTDNGEDRNISDPEEYKAIAAIENELGINLPEFFYWPGEMSFSEYEIFEEPSRFLMIYLSGDISVYFAGWKSSTDASANNGWEGEGKTLQQEYNGVVYTITEGEKDEPGTYYYVVWTIGDSKFSLSGITALEELEKILKNIKN